MTVLCTSIPFFIYFQPSALACLSNLRLLKEWGIATKHPVKEMRSPFLCGRSIVTTAFCNKHHLCKYRYRAELTPGSNLQIRGGGIHTEELAEVRAAAHPITHEQRDGLIKAYGTGVALRMKRPADAAIEVDAAGLGPPAGKAAQNVKATLVKKARQNHPQADLPGQWTPAIIRDTTGLLMWCSRRRLDLADGVDLAIDQPEGQLSILYSQIRDQTITLVFTCMRFVTRLTATGASSGNTEAGASASPGNTGTSISFIPALVASFQHHKQQFFTKEQRKEIFPGYSRKITDWQELQRRIGKLIIHKLKWDADPEFRVKCADEQKTRDCTSSCRTGAWGAQCTSATAQPPQEAIYDVHQKKVMDCYNILAPIKARNLDSMCDEYLTARQACMKIWYGDAYDIIPIIAGPGNTGSGASVMDELDPVEEDDWDGNV
jgi:hypothetical protein